jgi:hypothetical protein
MFLGVKGENEDGSLCLILNPKIVIEFVMRSINAIK